MGRARKEPDEQPAETPDAGELEAAGVTAAEPAAEADTTPDEGSSEAEAPLEVQAEPEAEADAEPAPVEEKPAPAKKAAPRKAAPKKAPKAKAEQKPQARARAGAKPRGARKPIVRTPRPERVRGKVKERRGTVVSNAMDKTIVVRVDTVRPDRTYKKVVRRSRKFHAHDERNEANVGDVVRIVETRPLSKSKSWRLAEVIEAAR